jgi:mono/diheme cytochrome c family protein
MKNNLITSLMLLTLLITACGGLATQVTPELVAPTQAVSQPTSVPTLASPAIDTAVRASDTALPATDAPVTGVSFSKDVMPILAKSCSECHGGKQMKEGLDLRTYESLMAGSFNGTVLVVGNSADSLLVQQLVNGKMPKRGPKLTPAQIKLISDWVDAGALNN